VQRDADEQVEGDLALVVADQPAVLAVDLSGGELGLQGDPLLGEQVGEMGGGDGLGEGAIERGDVGELDGVADAALAEVPVGQEAELQRSDRALDRHVDRVDDQPACFEAGRASRSAVAESSSKNVKMRCPQQLPVSPAVSSGSSDAPDATTRTS
jgi:hypothetical protein